VNSSTATYDAYGRMVEIASGTSYKDFVYRPSGMQLAVYDTGLGLVKGGWPRSPGAFPTITRVPPVTLELTYFVC